MYMIENIWFVCEAPRSQENIINYHESGPES